MTRPIDSQRDQFPHRVAQLRTAADWSHPHHLNTPTFDAEDRPTFYHPEEHTTRHQFSPTEFNPYAETPARPYVRWKPTDPEQPTLDGMPQFYTNRPGVTDDHIQRFLDQKWIINRQNQGTVPDGVYPADREPVKLYRGVNLDLRHPDLQHVHRALWGPEYSHPTNFAHESENPGLFPRPEHTTQDINTLDLGSTILDHLSSWHPDTGLGRHWTTDQRTAMDFAGDHFSHTLPALLSAQWMGRGEDPYRTNAYGNFHGENEITMMPGAPLRINQVHIRHPNTGKWHPVLRGGLQHREALFRASAEADDYWQWKAEHGAEADAEGTHGIGAYFPSWEQRRWLEHQNVLQRKLLGARDDDEDEEEDEDEEAQCEECGPGDSPYWCEACDECTEHGSHDEHCPTCGPNDSDWCEDCEQCKIHDSHDEHCPSCGPNNWDWCEDCEQCMNCDWHDSHCSSCGPNDGDWCENCETCKHCDGCDCGPDAAPTSLHTPMYPHGKNRPSFFDSEVGEDVYHFSPKEINPASEAQSRPSVHWEKKNADDIDPTLDLENLPEYYDNGQERVPLDRKPRTLFRGLNISLRHPDLAPLRRALYGDKYESYYSGTPIHTQDKRNIIPHWKKRKEPQGYQPGMFPGVFSDKELAADRPLHPDKLHKYLPMLLDHLENHTKNHGLGRHWSLDDETSNSFSEPYGGQYKMHMPYHSNLTLPVRMTAGWMGYGEDPYRRDTQETHAGEYEDEREITMLPGTQIPLRDVEIFHPHTKQWHSIMHTPETRIAGKGKKKKKKSPTKIKLTPGTDRQYKYWAGPPQLDIAHPDGTAMTNEEIFERGDPKTLYPLLRDNNNFRHEYMDWLQKTYGAADPREIVGMAVPDDLHDPSDQVDWAAAPMKNAPAGARWYHVSPHDLPVGTVLTPRGGPSGWDDFYNQHRMDHRRNWVWMEHDPAEAKFWAGDLGARNFYEVKPHATPQAWNGHGQAGWVAPQATILRKLSL